MMPRGSMPPPQTTSDPDRGAGMGLSPISVCSVTYKRLVLTDGWRMLQPTTSAGSMLVMLDWPLAT